VVGCSSELPMPHTDYCIKPQIHNQLVLTGWREDKDDLSTEVLSLGLCEGDCDTDDDCQVRVYCLKESSCIVSNISILYLNYFEQRVRWSACNEKETKQFLDAKDGVLIVSITAILKRQQLMFWMNSL